MFGWWERQQGVTAYKTRPANFEIEYIQSEAFGQH
jgi:hypothetical protein